MDRIGPARKGLPTLLQSALTIPPLTLHVLKHRTQTLVKRWFVLKDPQGSTGRWAQRTAVFKATPARQSKLEMFDLVCHAMEAETWIFALCCHLLTPYLFVHLVSNKVFSFLSRSVLFCLCSWLWMGGPEAIICSML